LILKRDNTNKPEKIAAANIEEDQSLYCRPFANSQLNSRLPVELTGNEWEIKWKSELDPFSPSKFILLLNDKYIIVQGIGCWRLFDTNGKMLSLSNSGDSDIVLDEVRNLLYSFDRSGFFETFNVPPDQPSFKVFTRGKGDRKRVFFARENDNLVIASLKKVKSPHEKGGFKFATCESYLLSNPPAINKRILSAKTISYLDYTAPGIVAALNGDNFVYSIKNKIFISDLELNTKNVIDEKFIPVLISLDEMNRIYLLIISEDKSNHLWIISTDGELVTDIRLPEISSEINIPPVISYDHKSFLVFKNQIFCFSYTGEPLWQTMSAGKIGGAIITANEFLLVSEGNLVMALNETGERKFIYDFSIEQVITPPVLTENNEILVATQNFLYCLSVKR
jgi:hypothetical protein